MENALAGLYGSRVLISLTDHLRQGRPLSAEQVDAAIGRLIAEEEIVELKANFLAALARKGETAEEIAAFARGLREFSLQPPVEAAVRERGILDVVGTGGDRLGTFNISTCAALIGAAAGLLVAKHGNRAVTSKTGSADVIEALGLKLDLSPEQAAVMLQEHGFVFLFAPKFHPAFRHIVPARKLCAARGQRTVFNFLGPLLNPVRVTAALVGVPRPELCEPLARGLREVGVRQAMVVSGQVERGPELGPDYLDEFSTLGETMVVEFYQERAFHSSSFSPSLLPLQPSSLAALKGGDHLENARIVREVLGGQDRGPRRDAVLLNAGAALFVAGRCRSVQEGWDLAGTLIDRGQALAKLEELVQASRRLAP